MSTKDIVTFTDLVEKTFTVEILRKYLMKREIYIRVVV